MRRVIFLSMLVAIVAACGGNSTASKVSNLASSTETSVVQSGSSSNPTSGPKAAPTEMPTPAVALPATPTQTPTPAPTSTPTPAPAPTPVPKALVLGEHGFGVNSSTNQLGYAFIVNNPNTDLAVTDSRYQVAAYAADGTVLKTDSGSVTIVMPNEKLGVAGWIFLSQGQAVDHVEIQLQPGKMQPVTNSGAMTSDKVSFVDDPYFPKVTGIVKNPYSKDLNQVYVSAIAYDADGKIIGGGFTFVDFVPANGQAAAEVAIAASGTPARVELYPTLSNLTLLGS